MYIECDCGESGGADNVGPVPTYQYMAPCSRKIVPWNLRGEGNSVAEDEIPLNPRILCSTPKKCKRTSL